MANLFNPITMQCCGEVQPALFPIIIPVNRDVTGKHPLKYTFHAKAICPLCKRFIKFVTQDDEIIEELKRQIAFYEKQFVDGKFDPLKKSQ